MKKFILTLALVSFGTAYAFPGVDYSFSAAPFAILQQNYFEKTEINDFKMKNNSDDYAEQLENQPRAPKTQKTKFNLNRQPTEQELQEINSEKQLINKDGKILIKSAE